MSHSEITQTKSYKQIIKSSSMVGVSQGFNILMGIVRTKCVAVLLGTSGVGLLSLYQSTTGIIGTICGLGIGNSGVRQIAEAAGSGDEKKLAKTIRTLRRVSLLLGFVGMGVVYFFRAPLSQLTFGNIEYADALGLISITLLFGSISGGQSALIQGMRRIGDLVKLSMIGAFMGTMLSIPMVYVWNQAGIALFLVAISATAILTSWWYARKIPLADVQLSWKDTFHEARGLISLGVVFMASNLMATFVTYLIRVMIVRKFGLEASGLYQAANTLSNIYIGFILSAMGADFYPRLTAVARDNDACNRMINEQAEVGLLIATPGLLATITFAPIVLHLF